MKLSWRTELPQLIMIAAMFAVAAWSWPHVPDRIPTHWNFAGEVDGYGGKFVGLLLLPLIASWLYLMMLFMPLIDPGQRNYARISPGPSNHSHGDRFVRGDHLRRDGTGRLRSSGRYDHGHLFRRGGAVRSCSATSWASFAPIGSSACAPRGRFPAKCRGTKPIAWPVGCSC